MTDKQEKPGCGHLDGPYRKLLAERDSLKDRIEDLEKMNEVQKKRIEEAWELNVKYENVLSECLKSFKSTVHNYHVKVKGRPLMVAIDDDDEKGWKGCIEKIEALFWKAESNSGEGK